MLIKRINKISPLTSIETDLILNVDFENNINDKSGHGHHGIASNIELTKDRFGEMSAYSFNGVNSWINFGSSSEFTLNENFAVSLWFMWQGSSGWILWNGNEAVGNGNTWMILANQNNRIAFEKYGFVNTWLEGPAFVKNTWMHIVAQGERNGRVCLYFDGNNIGCKSSGSTFNLPNPSPLVVGRRGPTSSDYFLGAIDDLKIFNRQLSESEIVALKNVAAPTLLPTFKPTIPPSKIPLSLR